MITCFLAIALVAGAARCQDWSTSAKGPTWNVVSLGAVGDGLTDFSAVFQAALDTAGRAGGGIVEVPAGRYRINGHLRVPANVTLQGVFRSAPDPGRTRATNLIGTVLLAYSGRGNTNAPAFIQLVGDNATLAGVIIEYPEWKRSDVPPVPYPPCVASENTENVSVQDCCLLNPYEGIRFVRAARHLIRNVTGYPIWRGIYVDECYDIGRIENVHFWPFGVAYNQDEPYCKWINTMGTAFEFARTDWHYVINTFCFGYGIGYRFSASKHGSCNGNFLGIGADSCERAVVVEQAQLPGLLITNGEFVGRWGSKTAVCLEVAPGAEGKVSLVNCSFWGPIDRCVWMRARGGQFTANACHFVQWDNAETGAPAVQLDAGRAIVQGCTFLQDATAVAVGAEVVSAILFGNQAVGGFRVENSAGDKVQIALNEPDPIQWTPEARAHYTITVGAQGDGRYLKGFHGAERSDRTFRWSSENAVFLLPSLPDKPALVTIELDVPRHALSDESGLYLADQRIAPLSNTNVLKVHVPASGSDRVQLRLRARGWIPSKVIAGSTDSRILGVRVFRVTVKTDGAGSRIFDANTGRFAGPDKS